MTERKGGIIEPLLVHPVSGGFAISESTSQNIATATTTKIRWAGYGGALDTNEFMGATNTWTAVHPGYYWINAQAVFAADNNGSRSVTIYINGAASLNVPGNVITNNNGAAIPVYLNTSSVVKLNTGDTVDVRVIHSSTTTPLALAAASLSVFPLSEKPPKTSLF